MKPMFRVDLKPKPAGFNAAKTAADMRAMVRSKSIELTIMSLTASVELERVPLVLEACALSVQAAELLGVGRTDE
jgi:hypothetical protein